MLSTLERLMRIADAPPLIERFPDAPPAADAGPAIIASPGDGAPIWLDGPGFRVLARPRHNLASGQEFARFLAADGDALACFQRDDGRIDVPFSLTEAYESYVSERWSSEHQPRSLNARQLDMYYRVKRLIPRRVQLRLRRQLIKWQGAPSFPRWPYDNSVDSLVRFYAGCVLRALGVEEAAFPWFWPGGAHAAVILTHDVEGAAGLGNALRIAALEEERGFRSSFNIVGSWYPIDRGIVDELRDRGHEIGSHAVYHDRSLFSSRTEFERQLPLLRDAVTRLDAVGFRSPATHRVNEWLGELPVEYDTTIPMSDPYEPQPGGACTAWPFFLGDVVELPYTLPQDHTIFTLLGHRSPALWVDQVNRIKQSFGLIQCVTHPDPGYLGERRNEAIYAEFLDTLSAEEDIWHALPREVARWWRARSEGGPTPSFDLVEGTVVSGSGGTLAEFIPPTHAAPLPARAPAPGHRDAA